MSRRGGRSARSAPTATATTTPLRVTVRTVGPLDPWRLPAVVVGVAVTSGAALLEATRTGVHLDLVLLRAFVVGLVIWVLLGVINRVLAQAKVDSAVERTRGELAAPANDPDPQPADTLP